MIRHCAVLEVATVTRGSAARPNQKLKAGTVDLVITRPSVLRLRPYADISDFFYVWCAGLSGT